MWSNRRSRWAPNRRPWSETLPWRLAEGWEVVAYSRKTDCGVNAPHGPRHIDARTAVAGGGCGLTSRWTDMTVAGRGRRDRAGWMAVRSQCRHRPRGGRRAPHVDRGCRPRAKGARRTSLRMVGMPAEGLDGPLAGSHGPGWPWTLGSTGARRQTRPPRRM